MDKMFIRKDVYEELLEKGFGKKDLSKLTKKKITDKNGHTRTVYVRNGEQPAEVKQLKAQEGLTPEKKARYEEMLEKVVAGPEENALFVKDKGMLNKKEAIAHLSEKLGKHAGEAMKNANDKANNLTSMSKEDKISLLSEYMHKKYGKTVESWKETYKAKLSDDELNQAFKDFSETHQETIKEYQKKKPVSSAAQGHLEADEPLNTDITKEDEERFGKQALSGLSGNRTSSEDDKTGYENTSIFELQDKFNSNEGKNLEGAMKDEHEKVKKELEKRTSENKPTSKGFRKGDTVFNRYGETAEVIATSGDYVYVKNSRGRKEWMTENSFEGKRMW